MTFCGQNRHAKDELVRLTRKLDPESPVPRAVVQAQLELAVWLTRALSAGTDGFRARAVLIFVAGLADIAALAERFDQLSNNTTNSTNEQSTRYELVAVHSELPFEQQRGALEQPNSFEGEEGPRVVRVVVATNAAESSLTLPDVDAVIDCCSRKLPTYDRDSDRLVLKHVWASRATAQQRAGRARDVHHAFREYVRFEVGFLERSVGETVSGLFGPNIERVVEKATDTCLIYGVELSIVRIYISDLKNCSVDDSGERTFVLGGRSHGPTRAGRSVPPRLARVVTGLESARRAARRGAAFGPGRARPARVSAEVSRRAVAPRVPFPPFGAARRGRAAHAAPPRTVDRADANATKRGAVLAHHRLPRRRSINAGGRFGGGAPSRLETQPTRHVRGRHGALSRRRFIGRRTLAATGALGAAAPAPAALPGRAPPPSQQENAIQLCDSKLV